jgi:hypothetical protein
VVLALEELRDTLLIPWVLPREQPLEGEAAAGDGVVRFAHDGHTSAAELGLHDIAMFAYIGGSYGRSFGSVGWISGQRHNGDERLNGEEL